MAPNAKKMKLLVTGASGFIGYEVARQLSVNGYKPRLMIRNPVCSVHLRNYMPTAAVGMAPKIEAAHPAASSRTTLVHIDGSLGRHGHPNRQFLCVQPNPLNPQNRAGRYD